MKIALYIEDGISQIILTPSTEHERGLLKLLRDESYELGIKVGQFVETKGGYIRNAYPGYYGQDHDSTMLVLRKRATEEAPEED